MGISRAPERMGSGATYLDGYGEGLEGDEDEDEDGVNQRLELAVVCRLSERCLVACCCCCCFRLATLTVGWGLSLCGALISGSTTHCSSWSQVYWLARWLARNWSAMGQFFAARVVSKKHKGSKASQNSNRLNFVFGGLHFCSWKPHRPRKVRYKFVFISFFTHEFEPHHL